MHKMASAMFSATECGSIVSVQSPRTFGITPAMFVERYSEHAKNGHCSDSLIVIALTTVLYHLNQFDSHASRTLVSARNLSHVTAHGAGLSN